MQKLIDAPFFNVKEILEVYLKFTHVGISCMQDLLKNLNLEL